MSATRRHFALVGIAVVIIVTAWIARVRDGRRSLAACESAFVRGDRVEAIVFARAAAEARCPWCAAPELGFTRLQAIAKDGENRGDDAVAVAAWRAARAATLAAVIFDTSPERRGRADAEIARIEHRIDAAAAAGGGTPSPAASEERLRGALAANTVPSTTVFVFLALGGMIFLYGALRFVRTKGRVVDLGLSAAGGGLAVIGLLLF